MDKNKQIISHLKFGRPASDQKLLDKFIDITKLCHQDETLEDVFSDETFEKTLIYLESLGLMMKKDEIVTESLKNFCESCYYMHKEEIDCVVLPGLSKKEIQKLKNCPNCNSRNLRDCYVYIKCENCLMEGPKMNKGYNDAHADEFDHKNAIEAWNKLPRIPKTAEEKMNNNK